MGMGMRTGAMGIGEMIKNGDSCASMIYIGELLWISAHIYIYIYI